MKRPEFYQLDFPLCGQPVACSLYFVAIEREPINKEREGEEKRMTSKGGEV